MSSGRATALGIVAALHAGVLAGLLLFKPDFVKQIVAPIEAVQVKEETPPPEEPPPPPPKEQEIPPYVPPPEVTVASEPAPVVITTQTTVAQPQPPVFVPPAPPVVAAPPAPPAGITRKAQPRGNQSSITTDDYPTASIRAEEEGRTAVSYTVSATGQASNCSVTQSSGFPRLDARTCELITKRFRFTPALNNGTPVEELRTQNVRWQLPKDR